MGGGTQTSDGLHTIDLILQSDTWVDSIGQPGADINAALIRGLYSTNVGASGWNRVARETLAFLAVTQDIVERVDDYRVTVTVPYISGYNTPPARLFTEIVCV